ncbi:MAG: DUF1501 domain-containing protein [Verrucomicrobiae bacterium]|nr:DUF1501 domain-containing protein [Verrucomicrobiae bacterium]
MNASFEPHGLHSTLPSRRQWLQRFGGGLGAFALADLLGRGSAEGAQIGGLPGLPHFAPKAKRVIFLFMSGGATQFETFDHKPKLKEYQEKGMELPDSYKKRGLLGMSNNQAAFQLVGSKFPFQQHGKSGTWVSDLFPHTASVADDLCVIRSMKSEAVNHDPGMIYMVSGAQLPGRPSMGSWITYGLGSETEDLPSFIVLVSRRGVDQPLSSRLWHNGFLPTQFQGTQFRSGVDPVLYLSRPPGVSREMDRKSLDRLKTLHEAELAERGESEIEARISQFEMAFRMQSSVPGVADLSGEPESVKKLYGEGLEKPGSFASNCLLARRLAERGVRYIHLYHPGWDHHGALPENMETVAKEIDQGCGALIQDLKQHNMLDDTLVIWGTEFGRTCYSQGLISTKTGSYGREHHRDAFTFWMAGGGIKAGHTHGETCELGFDVVENPVTVNDFHATVLNQLGIDHERLTYRFKGRDFRLTDVAGKVVKEILA